MLIFLVSFLVISLTTLIVAWYLKYFKFYCYLKDIPQLKQVPLLGGALEFPSTTAMHSRLFALRKELGKNFWCLIGMEPVLFTADPELLKILLTSNEEINKSTSYKFLYKWLGFGLLTSSGEKWRTRRKILTPAFHFKILEGQIETFNKASDILVKKLSAEPSNSVIDIYPFITLCSLDIICEAAMGTSVNAQLDANNSYVRSVKEMGKVLIERVIRPIEFFDVTYFFTSNYWLERRCLKYLHNFTNTVIQQRRKVFQGHTEKDEFGRKRKFAFLDILLSYSDTAHFSGENLREEVDTFMFEGHDTTSSGVSFALYLLATNQKEQEKAFAEICNIFSDDPHRPTTFKDLQEMKYLELIIKESLRILSSVPLIARTLKNNLEYDGKVLPKGLSIFIMLYVMHKDPLLFPNPEIFDPERFAYDQYVSTKNAFDYIPFSAGPRNCIGQKFAMLSMKSTISKVLRNFKLLPVQYEMEQALEAVLMSKNGVLVKLNKRQC